MGRQGALFILWHSGARMLTWHAPWCRDQDCAAGRWRDLFVFDVGPGYLRCLGFELSY